MIEEIKINKYICNQCKSEWITYKKQINNKDYIPVRCNHCNSKYWNRDFPNSKIGYKFKQLFLSKEQIELLKKKEKKLRKLNNPYY